MVVGITGALENETPIGTLVMPEIVVNSATGSEHRPDPMGDWSPSGRMWTTDVLITDAVAFENPPLKRLFGAQVAPPSVVKVP